MIFGEKKADKDNRLAEKVKNRFAYLKKMGIKPKWDRGIYNDVYCVYCYFPTKVEDGRWVILDYVICLQGRNIFHDLLYHYINDYLAIDHLDDLDKSIIKEWTKG